MVEMETSLEESLDPEGCYLSTEEALEYFKSGNLPYDYESRVKILPKEVQASVGEQAGEKIIYASDYPDLPVEELVSFTNTGIKPEEQTWGKILKKVPESVAGTINSAVGKFNARKSPALEA